MIDLELKKVHPGNSLWRQVSALYLAAFPPEERQSLKRLWLLSRLRPSVDFRACMLEDRFCGLVITVRNEKYLYIPFIAVSPEARGEGIGGRLLAALREAHPALTLLVEVEAPAEGTENQAQRLSRIRFYEHNGFHALHRTITGRGVTYELYATDTDYDRDAYFALFDQLSLGLRPLLQKLHR